MFKTKIIPFVDKLSFIALLALAATFFSEALSEIFTVTAIVGWWITQCDVKYRRFWKKIPLWSWALIGSLIVWGLFVSSISDYPGQSFAACFTKWGEWIFLGFACYSILSINKRWIVCTKALMWGSTLIILDGIFQIIFGFDLLRGHAMVVGIYPTASFSYYTGFAAYLVVFFLLGVALNLQPLLSKRDRVLLILHNALSFSMLVLTFSRGAWLAAGFGLTVLALWKEKKIIVASVMAIIPLFVLFGEQLLFRFQNPFASTWFGYRPEIWANTLEIIKVAPWTGIGVNNFSKWISDFSEIGGYSHNSYLQLTAEIGVPGMLLFLSWVLGMLFWATRQVKLISQTNTHITAFAVAMAGFMIHAFFDNLFYNTTLSILFGLLFGTMASAAISEEAIEDVHSRDSESLKIDRDIQRVLSNPKLKTKVGVS